MPLGGSQFLVLSSLSNSLCNGTINFKVNDPYLLCSEQIDYFQEEFNEKNRVSQ